MTRRPSSRPPVLIIQHAPHEHAATLRRALESQGIPSQVLRIWEAASLPAATEISGLVSLGGPMGANDEIDHPWILEEIRLMRALHFLKTPIAGICLGGQMLARALGGKVFSNPHPEIGWFEIELNEHGTQDPLMSSAGARPTFYQWHYDTFVPPAEAVTLARSPICDHQAFRIGDLTYGFQFHPEADYHLVDEWLNIEGTDEEILLARIAHHQACVQPPAEHRSNAKAGEISSLSFVAAISQLFQEDAFSGNEDTLLKRCEDLLSNGRPCVLRFYRSDGQTLPITGTLERWVRLSRGTFIFFRETTGLMWPVRLDHIHSLEPIAP